MSAEEMKKEFIEDYELAQFLHDFCEDTDRVKEFWRGKALGIEIALSKIYNMSAEEISAIEQKAKADAEARKEKEAFDLEAYYELEEYFNSYPEEADL